MDVRNQEVIDLVQNQISEEEKRIVSFELSLTQIEYLLKKAQLDTVIHFHKASIKFYTTGLTQSYAVREQLLGRLFDLLNKV